MANENKEIGDIVKKCKILLLDIEGTTTSISFVKDKLFPYAEENVKQFLDSQWETEDVKEVVSALRKLALEDQKSSVEGVVDIPGEDATKEDQIDGLVKNVKWQMSADRKAGELKQLQGLIWKQGYDNGDIKGHVFDDVSPALEQWSTVDGQKVYIYSSGSVQAQKLLFGQSLAGDLLRFIDGHFDTAVGAKQEAKSYENIVEKIGCKPEEVLFLTDIVKEAEAARSAGLHTALVSREGNAPISADAKASFPVLHSLADLTVSHKRKPEPQEEQTPAKVAKTDVDSDVKSSSAEPEPLGDSESSKDTEKVEKMDVEDSPTEELKAKKEEVIVEEVTDSNESAPVVDMEPIVEEVTEEKEAKTEEKQIENEVSKEPDSAVKNGDDEAPAAEKTTPTIVTEVEEIAEPEKLEEVAEIIEDLEPIVDEPTPSEDMDELQNVGEVLEKECDEILSKVQDVTNLDNIPIKPLLNPITEETMETDNTDSSDIVDRILDTELDLEMKQCADIDLNTVTEITEEAKTESEGEKDVNEASPAETNDVAEANVTGNVEAVAEDKIEENNPKETKADEAITEVQTEAEKEPVAEKETVAEVSSEETEKPTKTEENNTVTEESAPVKEVSPEANRVPDATDAKPESTTEVKSAEEAQPTEGTKGAIKESQVNGKTTNGEATVDMNGDVSKNEEVKSRLTENGLDSANGDSKDTEKEQGQGDCKVDSESSEIKVKTVSSDEPRTDPIEQPTEA